MHGFCGGFYRNCLVKIEKFARLNRSVFPPFQMRWSLFQNEVVALRSMQTCKLTGEPAANVACRRPEVWSVASSVKRTSKDDLGVSIKAISAGLRGTVVLESEQGGFMRGSPTITDKQT